MSNEDKIFDLMEKMYSEVQDGFKDIRGRLEKVETETLKTNIAIEQDIKPKLDALFDGYKQNAERLDRIEHQVSKQEEIIIRKVK